MNVQSTLDENQQKLLLLELALNALPVSLSIRDLEGRYKFVNAHQARNAGKAVEEIVGQKLGTFGGETWRKVIRQRDLNVVQTGRPVGPYRDDFAALFGLEGYWVTFKAPFALTADGSFDHIVTISFDVTPFVEAENQLKSAAYTDPLTELPNRRWFDEEVQRVIAETADDTTWLLMLDIDRFKTINDTYGHTVGDVVLREAGSRLQSSIRACDSAARFGGEEFVAIIRNVTELEVEAIAERVRQAFEEKPMECIKSENSVTVSIGGARIVGGDILSVVQQADSRLYHAKASGRNRVVLSDRHLDLPGASKKVSV